MIYVTHWVAEGKLLIVLKINKMALSKDTQKSL